MQGGGLNPDSGQYATPIGSVQRRKIYITKEQSEMLKEREDRTFAFRQVNHLDATMVVLATGMV